MGFVNIILLEDVCCDKANNKPEEWKRNSEAAELTEVEANIAPVLLLVLLVIGMLLTVAVSLGRGSVKISAVVLGARHCCCARHAGAARKISPIVQPDALVFAASAGTDSRHCSKLDRETGALTP